MKSPLLALVLILLASALYAQVPDSLSHRYDSLFKTPTTRLDSASHRLNNKIDSAQLKLHNLLNPDFKKLTSRLTSRNTTATDTLRAIHELDSIKSGLTHKIDTLKGLNLPTDRYARKLDSLNKITKPIGDVTQKINQPLDQVEQKINQPLNNLEDKVNEKQGVMRSEAGENANLPGNLSLDKASLPNANVNTAIPGAGDLKIPNTDINNPWERSTTRSPVKQANLVN